MADINDDTVFTPYANEADVIHIGELEIGNRVDRVTLTGDLVLTKDGKALRARSSCRRWPPGSSRRSKPRRTRPRRFR